MTETNRNGLADELIRTWAQQGREGFLLSDPDTATIETREALDESCGVNFRFRWMPHREIRGDVKELERRGILNPDRDESKLFRDPRDPNKRHCFLCEQNIRECHPMERLVPLTLAGRAYYAGANFAWIERDHFTVMSAEHTDQAYSQHALQAMVELHQRADGRFRVLFNGPGAGATIPWHLHYQITTCPMPIEALTTEHAAQYPARVHRFATDDDGIGAAHAFADQWVQSDPTNHTVNILVATPSSTAPALFVFLRDQRQATAPQKGLVGGFEVAGDFVLSAPREEEAFRTADVALARTILEAVRPSDG